MTRAELVRITQSAINACGKGHVNREDAGSVLDAVIEAFAQSLTVDEGLTLRNFGSFRVNAQAPRETTTFDGTKITVPAHNVVSFRASGALKDKVNGRA